MEYSPPSLETEESIEASLIPRLDDIFRNTAEYEQRILKSQDEDAQELLDIFQWILERSSFLNLDVSFKQRVIVATQTLSSNTDLYPTFHPLSMDNIEFGEESATASGLANICRARVGKHILCIKAAVRSNWQNIDWCDFMAAFKTEALTWGQLLHPHVLPVYGAYFFMSEPCLVVPWMKNRNIVEYLRDNIAAYRPQIAIDVVQGLAYLHEHGVIHGRIKGSKIFITKDGRACISDGIMLSAFSTIQSQASQSSAPSNGGSVRWQAPELIDLENDNVIPRTKASDIYALACVFYEIFTGTTPFAHLSKDALVMLNIKAGAKPSRPSDSGPSWTQWGLTQEIWLLMLDCWNTDPANRPTIESVKERLMGLEEHKSEQVVNSFPPGEPLRARMGGPTSLFKVSQHMLCTLVPQALPLIATTPRCVIKEVTMPMMTTLAKTLTSHFGPLKNFEMVFSMRWVLVEFVSIDAARLAIAASPVVLCVDAEETSVSIQHREHDASIVYKAKRRDGPNLKNYTPISRRSAKWDNME